MHKYVPLILIAILTFSSLMIIKPATSQITTPSVPEFTVQLVDRSYDEPPTYQTDPYTGQTVLIRDGRHVENKTFDFTIKNQPFTPYKNAEGKDVELYYKIRHKGQFEEWSTIFAPKEDVVQSSGSGSTSISFVVGEGTWGGISPNGIVDIQVKALIGYYSLVDDPYNRPWDKSAVFTAIGESDWSNTQTINMIDSTITSSPNASPTTTTSPSQTPISTPYPSGPQTVAFLGLDWLQVATVTLLGFIAVLLVFVVVFLRKRSINNKPV